MKHIFVLFILISTFYTTSAQTQEPKLIPQVDFQEMMQQMQEMMQSFPADSIYLKGMGELSDQFGNLDFGNMGMHMDSIMFKMQDMFSDIDMAPIQEELRKMEEDFRNRQGGEDQPKSDQKPQKSNEKKRKVTKL